MKYIRVNARTDCIQEKQNNHGIFNVLPFEKCAEHKQYYTELDHLVGQPSNKVIISVMA